MRLFAVHDATGRIYEAVLCPEDAPTPMLETTPGLTFTEVEPPESLTEDTDLRDLIKNHRVVEATTRQKSSLTQLKESGDY